MASLNGVRVQLVWTMLCLASLVAGYVMTENQIKEDIKFLSQTADGVKPSRLRALLLADLKRALPLVCLCVYDRDRDTTQPLYSRSPYALKYHRPAFFSINKNPFILISAFDYRRGGLYSGMCVCVCDRININILHCNVYHLRWTRILDAHAMIDLNMQF